MAQISSLHKITREYMHRSHGHHHFVLWSRFGTQTLKPMNMLFARDRTNFAWSCFAATLCVPLFTGYREGQYVPNTFEEKKNIQWSVLQTNKHSLFSYRFAFWFPQGIAKADMKKLVDEMIEALQLGKYADRQAGTLSGGNKRKLSGERVSSSNCCFSQAHWPLVLAQEEGHTCACHTLQRRIWS